MPRDFRSALARVQSDYDFYIRCQSEPDAALANYDLSPDERSALIDPDLLALELKRETDLRPITVKISGTHDWVNRAEEPDEPTQADELIAQQVEIIRQAGSDDEREKATLQLIQILG